jgi:hypothetical protein
VSAPAPPNAALLLAAALDAIAALLHLAVIAGGPAWYRFFGAGERMARMAEARRRAPTLITLAIAGVLTAWGAYALSGAGLLPALPLRAPVLCAITAVYFLRGLAIVPALVGPRGPATGFWIWSSLICLGIGSVHLVGVVQRWAAL